MAIRIEQNLFYVESKGLSLILENRDGYLMLKHLGRPIPSYHFSNTVHEKDHAFSGNPTPDNRTFSLDTQRQILGTARAWRFPKAVYSDPARRHRGDGFPLCRSQYLLWQC